MILNSDNASLIRQNAVRLAASITRKEDLADFATAANFEQLFAAIEALLTNTDMYFDDALLAHLDDHNWHGFKATLLVYTLNMINKRIAESHIQGRPSSIPYDRDLRGASANVL